MVEQGGQGAGTVIRFGMNVMGVVEKMMNPPILGRIFKTVDLWSAGRARSETRP